MTLLRVGRAAQAIGRLAVGGTQKTDFARTLKTHFLTFCDAGTHKTVIIGDDLPEQRNVMFVVGK